MATRTAYARVNVSIVLVAWLVIGLIVAANKGYQNIDSGSDLATFLLAVVLWPIPALGGRVGIVL